MEIMKKKKNNDNKETSWCNLKRVEEHRNWRESKIGEGVSNYNYIIILLVYKKKLKKDFKTLMGKM